MCVENLDRFKGFKSKIGSFDFTKTQPLLYSPPDITSADCVFIGFFCLASTERWDINESSKVYLRFAAPELGTFNTCHGPMIPTQRYVRSYALYNFVVHICMYINFVEIMVITLNFTLLLKSP